VASWVLCKRQGHELFLADLFLEVLGSHFLPYSIPNLVHALFWTALGLVWLVFFYGLTWVWGWGKGLGSEKKKTD
jgi:hypothetical protein